MSFVICNENITNYVGGEPSTMLLYKFATNFINSKGTQLEFFTQCFSGIADPLQKQSNNCVGGR